MLACMALWGRSGPYWGGGYGVGYYDSDARVESVGNERNRGTLRATLGAYINSNFSVELDYTDYEAYQGAYEGAEVEEDFEVIGVSVLPHWPLYDDKIDLFGRLGAGQVNWNERNGRSNSDSAGVYLLGIGVGYRIGESVMLKAGYDATLFSLDDAHRNEGYDMRLDLFYMGFEVMF